VREAIATRYVGDQEVIIIGAGLSGLICGRILQTKFIKPTIFEAMDTLPNNHSAILRFRSSVVGDRTSIPFRKVSMIKCVHPHKNTVADALTYSQKCSGLLRSDRSITSGTQIGERYIAPDDFIARLASDLDIQFSSRFNPVAAAHPVISTMPMPTLMKLLAYPSRPEFRSTEAVNVSFRVKDCDAFVSVYDPAPESPIARASITGDKVICECPLAVNDWDDEQSEFVVARAIELLGLPGKSSIETGTVNAKYALYSKILPIDEKVRKDFMHWATEKHNVYSLGRFATWKPGLLLDDLVKDIDQIANWARSNNSYERKQNAWSHLNGNSINA
jgi:hypothetical protein